MRNLAKAATALLGAVVLGTGVASAADMPEYPVIETPEVIPLPTGAWYLRGDIGYKIYADPDVKFKGRAYDVDYDDVDLDDTGLIGIGVGYKFNEYFRTDLTLDYEFKSGLDGSTPCPCGGSVDESFDLSAWTGLINAYVDLGTYSGLTPYLGAGIGFTNLRMSDIKSGNGAGGYTRIGSNDEWNFAWALMAGASYALSDNMLVDLNYRFLALGDASSDSFTAGTKGHIEAENIQAHEIRLGLRYMFN